MRQGQQAGAAGPGGTVHLDGPIRRPGPGRHRAQKRRGTWGALFAVLAVVVSLVLTGSSNASIAPSVAGDPRWAQAAANGWTLPAGTVWAPSGGFTTCPNSAGKAHLAVDLGGESGASSGTPVRAIGPGVIEEISTDISWGPGAIAVFVRHRAYDGSTFIATYGHITTSLPKGSVLTAGQAFGRVGPLSYPHLHFGIHPGPDPAPRFYQGSIPCSLGHYNGYVDPLSYLSTARLTPPDADGDGLLDANDTCPTVAGIASNGGCPTWGAEVMGDVDGGGRRVLISLANYGRGTSAIWVRRLTDAGTWGTPYKAWQSGPGQFDATRTKIVAVDPTHSGRTSLAAFYDYGGGTTGIWMFRTVGVGTTSPALAWKSAPGAWSTPATSSLSPGDVDGDGKQDIALLYDYGGTQAGLWVFRDAGGGTLAPTWLWQSCRGCWSPGASKLVVADHDGDGVGDPLVLYAYPGTRSGLWRLPGFTGPRVPTLLWMSCAGCWDAARTDLGAADLNGDGKVDLDAYYNYGGYYRRWVFYGPGPTGTGSYPRPFS